MNRPRYITPYSPRCSSRLSAHPAPLSRTLCVSAFTVFTSTIQHLSTRSLPPLLCPLLHSSRLPPSLSLILNKKSFLLIARNLRDSTRSCVCYSRAEHVRALRFYFVFFYLHTLILRVSLVSCLFIWSPSCLFCDVLFCFFLFFFFFLRMLILIICLFANYLHMHTCIIVACLRRLDFKAAVNFLLSLSLLPLAGFTPRRFIYYKGTFTQTDLRRERRMTLTKERRDENSSPFIPTVADVAYTRFSRDKMHSSPPSIIGRARARRTCRLSVL